MKKIKLISILGIVAFMLSGCLQMFPPTVAEINPEFINFMLKAMHLVQGMLYDQSSSLRRKKYVRIKALMS